jgi:EF hand
MLKRTNIVGVVVLIAVVVATGAMLGNAVAQKASVPKPENKLAIGVAQIKELVLLMDTDRNGKISKQEYMTFMGAEFDRLDKNKSGDLDVKELKRSRLIPSYPAPPYAGK